MSAKKATDAGVGQVKIGVAGAKPGEAVRVTVGVGVMQA
jgi:hypothetical protein